MAADLVGVGLHGFGVCIGHGKAGADAAHRADGAQSRSVWRPVPPIRVVSSRLIPSATATSDRSRRLCRTSFVLVASRRNAPAE